jgi:hypothetical protein
MSSRNNNIVSIIVRLPSFLNPSLRKRKRRTKDNKDNSPSSKDEFCYLNKPSLLTTTIIQGKGASKNGKLRTLFVTENGFIYRENASKSYQKKNKESLKRQRIWPGVKKKNPLQILLFCEAKSLFFAKPNNKNPH